MNLLQEALITLLSGLTHTTGKEIHWEDEDGDPITVEPVDIEKSKYIVRYYWEKLDFGSYLMDAKAFSLKEC
jgi:hypothetical protein